MTHAIRVSRQGIDALGTAGTVPNNLIFDSNLNTLKIISTGTVVGTVDSGVGTVSHNHNLGYAPAMTAFLKKSNDNFVVPIGGQRWLNALVDNFKFVNGYTDGTSGYFEIGNSGTYYVRYYYYEIPF